MYYLSTTTVSLWYDIITDSAGFEKVMQLSIEIRAGNQDKGCESTCYFSSHPLSKHTKCIYAHRRKMRRVATLLNLVVFACSLEFKTQVDVQWHLRRLALSIHISSISRDEIQFSLCAPGCQSPLHPRKVWKGVTDRQIKFNC